FVESHNRSLRAAGGYDNDGAINQRRLCISPKARLAAEFFLDVLLPANLAALGFEAGEVAVRAKRVNGISVNSRRRPRFPVLKVIRAANIADARCPERFTILG